MPKLQLTSIESLRPTQLTVGMIEVEAKRKHLATLSPKDQQGFLEAHPMPVVIGPGKELYITDHHHLARAALEAGVDGGYYEVEADLASHDTDEFWDEMNKNSWVHPLDQNGVRHRYVSIPSRLNKLVDDVYRSLAGFVRDAGGFEKTRTAFAEFIWADFFRRNVSIEDLTADFDRAVRHAQRLARSPLAKGIPGFKDT
jgi:hypothetical protein